MAKYFFSRFSRGFSLILGFSVTFYLFRSSAAGDIGGVLRRRTSRHVYGCRRPRSCRESSANDSASGLFYCDSVIIDLRGGRWRPFRGRVYDDFDTELPRCLHESDGPVLDVQGEWRVLNLDGCDGGMRPTKSRTRDLGESEVFGLPSPRGGERHDIGKIDPIS